MSARSIPPLPRPDPTWPVPPPRAAAMIVAVPESFSFHFEGIMNFLIVGDGAEDLAWARAIVEDDEHRLVAAYPGFEAFPEVPRPSDFEDALAMVEVGA